MKPRRSSVARSLPTRGGVAQEKRPSDRADVSSYLSYALLVLYVLASVSATKDQMLLVPNNGVQLPLVGVTVSVVGFYLLSPLIVLVGHLVTLRRIPQTFANITLVRVRSKYEQLNRSSDYIMCISLLFAGPITLFFITYRFAAYQSPFLFLVQVAALVYACYASAVRYQEILHRNHPVSAIVRWVSYVVGVLLGVWLLLAADVILAPAKYSITLWLKARTVWLSDADGGAAPWIPHIHIDRATPIWTGNAKGDDSLAQYSGSVDSDDLFMTRGVALDLRSRNLRFVDLSQQVIPRIWAHGADLSGANLSFTRLYGSVFVDTNLRGANFDMASLDGSSFMHMTIDGASFRHSRLRGTIWDSVAINDAVFEFAELSLASLYGVELNRVLIKGSNLTAISLFETKAEELAIGYDEPYKIVTARQSDSLMRDTAPVFDVSPQAALAEIAKPLCRPNIDVGWSYAWLNFERLKSMTQAVEPEVASALRWLLEQEQCKGLPRRGWRISAGEDAGGEQ